MAQRSVPPTKEKHPPVHTAGLTVLGLAGVLVLVIGITMAAPRIGQPAGRDDPGQSIATSNAPIAEPRVPPAPMVPALFSDAYVATLMSIPEFAARAKALTAPQRRDLAMALASRGVQRLDDESLGARAAHLAAVLDRLDDSLCFNVAVGIPLTSGQWMRVLEAMDASDSLGTWAEDWGRAYRAAIVAELRKQPKRKRDTAAAARAIEALRNACTDDERRFFARAGEGASSMADFAAGLRLTYRKVPELSPADRTAVLRLLVDS